MLTKISRGPHDFAPALWHPAANLTPDDEEPLFELRAVQLA